MVHWAGTPELLQEQEKQGVPPPPAAVCVLYSRVGELVELTTAVGAAIVDRV
jgi:hypothetical protein